MKQHNSTRRKRFLAVLMILFITILTILVLLYSFICLRYKSTSSEALENAKSVEFDKIEKYIHNLHKYSEDSATLVAKNIESQLYSNFNTEKKMKKLYDEFENDNYSSICYIITNSSKDKYLNGVNNQRNSIIVATNKDILYNMDYVTSCENETATHSTWNIFIRNNYNKSLAKNAVLELTRASNDYIFIEPVKSDNEDHLYEPFINMETLKKIYKSEGLDGLKTYQMLVPVYIKNANTDLFGQYEITAGIHHDTYRIMVIQRCNIYDQIINNRPSMNNSKIEDMAEEYDKTLSLMYIIECFSIVIFLVAIYQTCFIFNMFVIGTVKDNKSTK